MIVYFSQTGLFILILASLALITGAFITLLLLLLKDYKSKEIW